MQRERKYFPVSFWYKERFLQSKRCRAEIERPVRAHASYGVKITTEGKFFVLYPLIITILVIRLACMREMKRHECISPCVGNAERESLVELSLSFSSLPFSVPSFTMRYNIDR